MRRLLAIAVSIALLVSFSVLAMAAEDDYSLTTPELVVSRTITYGWEVEGSFTPDAVEVEDTSVNKGETFFLIEVARSVNTDILGFDLDLNVVAEDGAGEARLEEYVVVLQVDADDTAAQDWQDLVVVYEEDLPGTIEDKGVVVIDREFSLDLATLDEEQVEAFEEADGYRLEVFVTLEEGALDHTYNSTIGFALPDEEDVVYEDADVEVETNLVDALGDAGLYFALNHSDDDWDVDEADLVLDEEDGVFKSEPYVIDVTEITGDDGSYDVEVELEVFGDDAEDAIAAATANLEVILGEEDDEDDGEPARESDRDRDRDAWENGLHPVHGMWMPPATPGQTMRLGNNALPLKFWLADNYTGDVSLILFDDEDLGSGDVVHEWKLNTNNEGMYRLVLHLKKLDFELESGEYWIAVKAGSQLLDDEGQVLTIQVVEMPGLNALGRGNANNENGRGHGKGE